MSSTHTQDQDGPLVSIICHTYNHAPYIAQALDSFLMQRVAFRYEIIVHDDASTDGTADIVRRYSEQHPGVVVPILQQENQYSRGRRAFSFTLPRARGRYIALCEGDDYWQDPDKLAQQVAFLDAHPDYVVCYHDACVIDDQGALRPSKQKASDRRDYSAAQLKRGAWMLTLTMCFRNVLGEVPEEQNLIVNADRFLASRLGFHGKGKYLAHIKPAVYRVHEGGVWSARSHQQRCLCQATTYYWIGVYHARQGRNRLGRYFILKAAGWLLKAAPPLRWPLSSAFGLATKVLFGRADRRRAGPAGGQR